MTALAIDTEIESKGKIKVQSFKLGASKTIYKGALVACDATTGLLEPATDAAAKPFVGIAAEGAISGASDTVYCKVYTDGIFKLTAGSLIIGGHGKLHYVLDSGTATTGTGATNETGPGPIGVLVEYLSSTSGWFDIGQRAGIASA